MIKLLNIIGARPQIIKAAAISRIIKDRFSEQISEVILHTGQHYDVNMSQVFIRELMIPEPAYNLEVGSKTHGKQTAEMIIGLEEVITEEQPDYVLAYGDTNSTLAAAVAVTKMNIPLVHVEAGMRSFTKLMPEEINRVLCDHSSTILFSPTATGLRNLVNEGFNPDNSMPFTINNPGIIHCGDIMYDNSIYFSGIAEKKSRVLEKHHLRGRAYNLMTIHRPVNTDDPKRLSDIFEAVIEISESEQELFVVPLHPRTAAKINSELNTNLNNKLKSSQWITIIDPVSFLDMIMLEKEANMVFTDSGGVQKEAYFFEKPCIVIRQETEWVELTDQGAALLADADKTRIIESHSRFRNNPPLEYPPIFGDGQAAATICSTIIDNSAG